MKQLINNIKNLLSRPQEQLPTVHLPKGGIPFKTANELLEPHVRVLNKIRQECGASKDFFERYYMPAINKYAELMQLRPADNEGPYAVKGGTITLTLQRVLISLKLRQGYLLPLNVNAEEIAYRKEVWTYGVFTAALLRNMGGQLLNYQIVGFDASDKVIGSWFGWYHELTEFNHYRMKPYQEISRSLAQASSIIQIHNIIPRDGQIWMYQDNELMDCLLDTLGGAHKKDVNPLYKITLDASTHAKENPDSQSIPHPPKQKQKAESVDMNTGEVMEEQSRPEPEIQTKQSPNPEVQSQVPEPVQEEAVDESNQPDDESYDDFEAERFISYLKRDLAEGKLMPELAVFEGNLVKILYPSTFTHYTNNPSQLLSELRVIGMVAEEGGRKPGQRDRTITLRP